MGEIFLIDTNSLITPHLQYYPFDFAKSFWNQIERNIEQGNIVLLDMVRDEILKGSDSLSDWMENLEVENIIDHKDQSILLKYAEILQYIQGNPCYSTAALTEWSKETVADAWLIATAATCNYTIVTFEGCNNDLNSRFPSKNPKIPDVSKAFNVKVQNLFYMMRALNFKL